MDSKEPSPNPGSGDLRTKMAQFYMDTVDQPNTDHRPCAGVREDLKQCLLLSDCVVKHHKSPKECLRLSPGDPLAPHDCFPLRNTFFECKRSLLDARQRFRGRKGY